MARINGSVSQRSDSYSFYIDWSESLPADYLNTNTSTVSATAYIYCSKHSAYESGLPQTLVIDGTTFTDTKYVSLSSGVTVALISGTKTIEHNSDGTKSITISASCDLPDGGGWGPAWGSASGTATLSQIPRYTTVTNSERGKTLNSISVNWATTDARDWTQYSLNGGSWRDAGDTVASNQRSGYYTIFGLSPNTTYTVKTRCRRADSGLWSEAGTITITTQDIAKINSYSNFNLGSNISVGYTNPSGASTVIGIYATDASTPYAAYRAVAQSPYEFNFTNEELDTMYKAMGNSNTLNALLYLRTTGDNYYYDVKAITISLTGNQKTGHINVSGSWKRTKKWVNVNGSWKRCVRWVNVNGSWKRCI